MSGPNPPDGRPVPALARPYAWTDGRTRPAVELAMEALVLTTPEGQAVPFNRASPLSTVTQLCLQPRSMAEIAAYMSVPLQVVRVLVADLLASGWVVVRDTLSDHATWDERHDLLERVLSGLRTL